MSNVLGSLKSMISKVRARGALRGRGAG